MMCFFLTFSYFFFFFKQKTAYEMRISDWSSDVCSSDLPSEPRPVYSRCWGEGGRNVLSPLNKRHAGQRRHLVPEIRARDLARHVDRHRMAKTACGLGERSD